MTGQPVSTAAVSKWNNDMMRCPAGTKCLLLTSMGIAVIGQISGSTAGYVAWSPLPKINKHTEAKGEINEHL